ncbi:MAG: DNA polymerase [Bryobacteraceae bacterium]
MTLSGLTGVMQEPHSFARGDRNLGFDLHWLFRETSCRPAFVYDTLLLARQCQPELLLGLNHVAAVGPEREQEEAIELLTGAGEKGGGSLEYLSTIVGLPRPNKAHQKPANWVVSVLSPEHFDYAMADINNPLAIIWHMFGTANPQKLRPRLERKFRWYAHYQTALVKHACLRDMPFDREIGAKIKHRYTQACRAVANRFRRSWPDICNEEVAAILADPAKGTAKPVKQAFAALAASKGIELPTTETGEVSTSLKDWRYRGIDQSFPEFYTLRKKLSDYKKGVETIESLEEFSRKDGSVYPMVCFSTAAGRASSQNPNVQGFPRERRLRRAFGRRGYKVVKTDYSSIELRIGASLANRALAETRKHLAHVRNLHDFEDSDYFLRNAWVGMQCKSVDFPPESAPEGWSADDWRMERPARLIRYFANRTRRLDSQCLETIFRHRVDPHLVTGLDDGAARRADRDRGRHCPMAAGARKTRN